MIDPRMITLLEDTNEKLDTLITAVNNVQSQVFNLVQVQDTMTYFLQDIDTTVYLILDHLESE